MDGKDVTDAGRTAASQGKDAARQVQRSKPYQVLVKVGLVDYGLVHLIIAWLAFGLARGAQGEGEASNTGALRQLAEAPVGAVLMWVVAIGLLTLVVWQAIAAAVGYREYEGDGFKRTRKRLSSVVRMIVYGSLGVAALRIASGPEPDEGESVQESASAGLMGLPFGQFLVGLVGLAVIGYGVWQIVKGVTGRYNEEIETELSGAAAGFATAGHIAKGIAYAVMGGLFIWAAASFDPEKVGGLDRALETIRYQPLGNIALIVMAVGIACYGIWCFYWAMHAKHA